MGSIDNASHAERALWFIHAIQPDECSYHVAFTARATHALEPALVERAFQQLVARHDALRTTFVAEQGELRRVVHAERSVVIDLIDARGGGMEAARRALSAYHRAPFDLERGPLVRLAVVELDGDVQALAITVHHIVSDFASLELMVAEVGELYLAHRDPSRAGPLPPSRALADYVSNERPPSALATSQSHWLERLASAPPPVCWPWAGDRRTGGPAVQRLDAALTASLVRFAQEVEVTVFCVILATWGELLARATGRRDWVIGAPTTLRDPGFARTVGNFVSSLPLRWQSDPRSSFRDLARTVWRTAIVPSMRHRHYPFGAIVEALQPSRELDRNPLFQTMVVMQRPSLLAGFADLYAPLEDSAASVAWADGALAPWAVEDLPAHVDLELELVESRGGLRAIVRSRAAQVPPGVLPELASGLRHLLQQLLDTPDRPLAEISGLVAPRATELTPSAAPSRAVAVTAPPTNELERAVAAIWCEVLGRSQVGIDDPFFHIGGSSHELMRVLARVSAFPGGAALTATDLFRSPTVRALAQRLAGAASTASTAPVGDPTDRRRRGATELTRRRAARADEPAS